MQVRVYGNLNDEGLEVIERDGRLFVRYDAGSHQIAWREDEISEAEFVRLRASRPGEYAVIAELQRRLSAVGADPHCSNWSPSAET